MREYPEITRKLKRHCLLLIITKIIRVIIQPNIDVGIIRSKKDGNSIITIIIKETN